MTSRRILLIDDDYDQLLVLKSVLEQENCIVICASSASEGFEKLKEQAFECIVCDVMMPRQDGLTFVRSLRQMPQHAFEPVIMLSAAREDMAESLLECGADKFCLKRNAKKELPALIEQLIAERGAAV